MGNPLRNPWQVKYSREYAIKVDSIIDRLDCCRSTSKISRARERIVCPQMLTKKDFKILCNEIGRALQYYSNGSDSSIYSLKCNEPK